MDATTIIDTLKPTVPGARFEAGTATDQPTISVEASRLVETCRALRDTPALDFAFLADVTAVDWWPREPRFEVVYLLASLANRIRLRLKVLVPGADPHVPTVVGVWPAAQWLEREVWDLFGIVFDGHPDLRRLLMPDDWEGHPLRKDHPVQIKLPARATEPLQVSEEEFRASVAADRVARAQRGTE